MPHYVSNLKINIDGRWNATPKFYLMDHQSIMSDAYMYMQKQSKIKQKRYNAFNHVVV